MSLAHDGRARHWLLDAILGGSVALGAITVAQAALPDRFKRIEPPPVQQIAPPPPVAAAVEPPPELIAFAEPVPGRDIVSPFGLRQMPWEDSGRLHAGVDISAEPGERVLATADGVVTQAGRNSTYGRFVAVRHAAGLTSFYAHLGAVDAHVAPGRALKAGQVLGRIGSTGTSTGPHLHFEIRDRRDRPLNPSLFLGRSFAEAGDLPIRAAQRFGRRVRVAHVSAIPKNKRAVMEAKLEREAAERAPGPAETAHAAADRGQNASVTIFQSDGRPRGVIRPTGDREPSPAPAATPAAPAPPVLEPEAIATAVG